jgi:hypothetical protein
VLRAPLALALPDEAWFDVGLMQKDIRLALALAVSTQSTPSSSAWWMAAIESSSSWDPQPQS